MPVLLALILRVHATHVFTAIVSGWLLSQTLAPTVGLLLSMTIKSGSPDLWSKIGLLVLPLVVTLLVLRKSMKKSLLLQFVPLLASGLLFTVLLLELIPQPFQSAVYMNQIGAQLRQSGDLVIGGSVLINLALMWLLYKHKAGKEEHGKH